MNLVAGRARNSYCTGFLSMLELPVAAALSDNVPAIAAQYFDYLSDLHGNTRGKRQ
jgi:hypothetical protein